MLLSMKRWWQNKMALPVILPSPRQCCVASTDKAYVIFPLLAFSLPLRCSTQLTFSECVVNFKRQERATVLYVLVVQAIILQWKTHYFLSWLFSTAFSILSHKSNTPGESCHGFLSSPPSHTVDSAPSEIVRGMLIPAESPLKKVSLHKSVFSISVRHVWQQSESIWVKGMSREWPVKSASLQHQEHKT